MAQYFEPEPNVGSERRSVRLTLPDLTLDLATDRGVFSAQQVDRGTRLLLLEGPAPAPADRVLVDLGAGYGPIACTLAVRNPGAEVLAVEINRRARELCAENARVAGLDNVRVIAPDEVQPGLTIDRLWSNPPIRIGKPALQDLLREWLARLRPAGSSHLVVQRHLGSDSLQRWLASEGWMVDRRLSRKGYRLLDVRR